MNNQTEIGLIRHRLDKFLQVGKGVPKGEQRGAAASSDRQIFLEKKIIFEKIFYKKMGFCPPLNFFIILPPIKSVLGTPLQVGIAKGTNLRVFGFILLFWSNSIINNSIIYRRNFPIIYPKE